MNSPAYIFGPSEFFGRTAQTPILYQASCSDEWHKLYEAWGKPESISQCPYCISSPRLFQRFFSGKVTNDAWAEDWEFGETLHICSACTWVSYYRSEYAEGDTWISSMHYVRTVSKKLLSATTPILELRNHLARKWKDHIHISATQAEDLVASIFAEHLNAEIHYVTNGVYTPDGGIDFVLVETPTGLEHAFQVKRRLTDKSERITEVREFLGAMAGSDFNHGYYVTFAPQFSGAARKEVKNIAPRLKTRKLNLKLIDGSFLRNLLRQHSHKSGQPLDLNAINVSRTTEGGWIETPLRSANLRHKSTSPLTLFDIAGLVNQK